MTGSSVSCSIGQLYVGKNNDDRWAFVRVTGLSRGSVPVLLRDLDRHVVQWMP